MNALVGRTNGAHRPNEKIQRLQWAWAKLESCVSRARGLVSVATELDRSGIQFEGSCGNADSRAIDDRPDSAIELESCFKAFIGQCGCSRLWVPGRA